jgi:hypothetical protein
VTKWAVNPSAMIKTVLTTVASKSKKKDDNQREKKKEKVSYFNFFDWRN